MLSIDIMDEMNTTKPQYHTSEWKIDNFYVSDRPEKKYYVVLVHKFDTSRRPVKMYFGGKKKEGNAWVPYEQFRDSTPLGAYSDYDHGERDRLLNFLRRHGPFNPHYFTPNLLSYVYLWS
jgi:fructose 1,6-bisphosphatase